MANRLRPLVLVALAGVAGLVACSRSPAAYSGSLRSTATTTRSATQGLDPGPGQAFVTGAVERFVADDAQPGSEEVLATPFTLTARERGAATVAIENALVDGKPTTISWNSGTPLPITATGGGLELGVLHVEVDGAGITWGLDGGARPLRPGAYRAAAPVAVGGGKLAAARDAVDFTADARTTLVARGGVLVHVPGARRLQLQGPGTITVTGSLRVRTPTSQRSARTVVFGPGPFRVTLAPGPGGVTVDALLQGRVTAT